MTSGPSDPDLAAQAARGNREAFAELVRRHQATVRGMLRRLSGNASNGDDLSQATFIRAWTQIKTYRGGVFRSWLCAIAYREFLQYNRRRAAQERGRALLEDATVITITRDHSGLSHDIDRALSKLPDAQRIAVTLCVAAGLSHNEAAIATGWPLGTVKSHVTRGKAALRRILEGYGAA